MTSLVEQHYPDFDDTLPEIEGFKDTSDKNDLGPSLTSDELGIMLFVDYKDRSLAKYPENPQMFWK